MHKNNRFWTAIIALALLLAGCVGISGKHRVLPTQRSMAHMNPTELRTLILGITPIGTTRADVEAALTDTFHRKWEVVANEAVEYMSNLGFEAHVSDGDYYLRSDLASVGWPFPEIVTVRFLFDQNGNLKDVATKTWINAF